MCTVIRFTRRALHVSFIKVYFVFKLRYSITTDSKISSKRVEKVEDVLSVGDEVRVKVTDIDNQGRINLSMKDLEVTTQNEN